MKLIIDIPKYVYDLASKEDIIVDADIDKVTTAIKVSKLYEERPTGHWVVQRLQNGFDDVYCPFCNARPTRSEYGYYLKDKFCHECGADMRGIDE